MPSRRINPIAVHVADKARATTFLMKIAAIAAIILRSFERENLLVIERIRDEKVLRAPLNGINEGRKNRNTATGKSASIRVPPPGALIRRTDLFPVSVKRSKALFGFVHTGNVTGGHPPQGEVCAVELLKPLNCTCCGIRNWRLEPWKTA